MEDALGRHGSDAELRNQLATIENNLFQAHYLAKDPAAALAAAERGLAHLEAGLQADARHVALRELFAGLVGRVAIARMSTDDVAGGLDLLLATCERADRGEDAREQAALLLSQCATDADDPERRRQLLAGAQRVMRERVVARGDVAAALARPIQLDGASSESSRLRDFDLRVALGQVADALGEDDDQRERALREAETLEATLPGLDTNRLRNLYAQIGELAVLRRDADAAAQAARTLLARAGERGGACYVAASLLAEAAVVADGSAAAAMRAEAAAALARAVADGEAPAAAADQPRFHALRGLPAYDALLRR